jgi:hypothetical protein
LNLCLRSLRMLHVMDNVHVQSSLVIIPSPSSEVKVLWCILKWILGSHWEATFGFLLAVRSSEDTRWWLFSSCLADRFWDQSREAHANNPLFHRAGNFLTQRKQISWAVNFSSFNTLVFPICILLAWE